ncbi:MAG: STN domain-containing protein, partial [Gemmatimonadaceae bacterium]
VHGTGAPLRTHQPRLPCDRGPALASMRPTGRVLGFIAATLLPAGVAAQSSRAPSAVIEAQPPLVSVALIDVPRVEALEALSQSARMNLVWQATTLGEKASRRIACRFTNARPEDVLGCITRGAGLDYVRLSSGTYVVIPGPE